MKKKNFRKVKQLKIKRLFVAFVVSTLLPGFGSPASAGENIVHLKLNDFQGDRAYLAAVKGDQTRVIDSAIVVNGEIEFSLNEENEPGLFRVYFDNPEFAARFNREPEYVDFLYNHENVKLHTSFLAPFDKMKVISSVENSRYFEFLEIKSKYREKLGLLLSLMEVYSSEDVFFESIH